MTHEEIATMIAGIGLPYAYHHFEPGEAVDPPFICFLYPARNDFVADGKNYVKITELDVELYTDEPDFTLEASVEDALDAADLVYTIEGPTYIDSERMYMTTFSTSVILDDSISEVTP